MTLVVMGLVALAIGLAWPAPGPVGDPAAAATERAGGDGAKRRLFGLLPARRAPEPTADVDDLAAVLDMMALALDSGCAVTDALEAVADEVDDPLAGHLRQVVAARRWGVTGIDAWRGLPPQWEPAARALTLAQLAGAPPADTIRRAAADLRRDRAAELDRAAARLPVFLVIPLGTVFMPAFVLIAVVPLVVALATQTLGHV
ncbi:type II secretion system F family protein [Kytococcus sedentarius]|uniref:type II secretion system F family protein n=1 Tax=Kytococcus sedentarius TaxID=1276 RepID=UPI0035BC1172